MDDQDKNSKIERLTAENEELTAEVERLRRRNRELSAQTHMAKQYVEETHSKLMQVHVNAQRKLAVQDQRRTTGFPDPLFDASKDARWDIS